MRDTVCPPAAARAAMEVLVSELRYAGSHTIASMVELLEPTLMQHAVCAALAWLERDAAREREHARNQAEAGRQAEAQQHFYRRGPTVSGSQR